MYVRIVARTQFDEKIDFALLLETSKTRFYNVPAAAKVFLGLSQIEGKGKLVKA